MCGNHHPAVSQNTLGKLPKTPPVCSRPIHLSDLMCSLHLPILYILQSQICCHFQNKRNFYHRPLLYVICVICLWRFAAFVLFWFGIKNPLENLVLCFFSPLTMWPTNLWNSFAEYFCTFCTCTHFYDLFFSLAQIVHNVRYVTNRRRCEIERKLWKGAKIHWQLRWNREFDFDTKSFSDKILWNDFNSAVCICRNSRRRQLSYVSLIKSISVYLKILWSQTPWKMQWSFTEINVRRSLQVFETKPWVGWWVVFEWLCVLRWAASQEVNSQWLHLFEWERISRSPAVAVWKKFLGVLGQPTSSLQTIRADATWTIGRSALQVRF